VASTDDVITIRLEPIGGSKKNVGFEALIAELQAVHGTLVRADKLTTGKQTTRYDVDDLTMNSPARIAIAPRSLDRKVDRRDAVVGEWASGLVEIGQGTAPEKFDRPMLEKVREIASGVRKRRVRTVIEYREHVVRIDHLFERRIVAILDRTERMFGSIEGKLEAVNLHNQQNICAIYPKVGARKVMCHFSSDQRQKVMACLDHWVLATGMAEYQYRDAFPHRLELRDLDAMDLGEAPPSLHELRGIAPDATGDEATEDFVRRIRNGWH
jgi:hypothetical protein